MPPRRVSQAAAIASVAAVDRKGQTIFIGIDGPGGAGKSALAARMAAVLPDAVVVAVDDFSGPQFAAWNWHRFVQQVRDPLLAGRAARYQRWDWDRDEGAEWRDIAPGGVVIVEGVSSTRAEAGVPWALRVWVETPREVRLARALERDGPDLMARWFDDWIPSEEAYIAAQKPDHRADLVVSGAEPR
jgi:uridine kinase